MFQCLLCMANNLKANEKRNMSNVCQERKSRSRWAVVVKAQFGVIFVLASTKCCPETCQAQLASSCSLTSDRQWTARVQPMMLVRLMVHAIRWVVRPQRRWVQLFSSSPLMASDSSSWWKSRFVGLIFLDGVNNAVSFKHILRDPGSEASARCLEARTAQMLQNNSGFLI